MVYIGWLAEYSIEFQIQMTLGSGIYVGWVGAATAIFVSVLYFMGMSFLCISDFLGLIQDKGHE